MGPILWAWVLLAAGCHPLAEDDRSSSHESAIVLPYGPAILDASPLGAPGAHIFVTPTTFVALEVWIGGVPCGPATWEDVDNGAALYRVPDLAYGMTTLSVRISGEVFDSDRRAFEVVPPAFVDVASEVGLDHEHVVKGAKLRCSEAQTGVGFADVDGDGNVDGFVGNYGSPSVFYRNQGDIDGDHLPDFIPETALVGLDGVDLVTSVSFVDYDEDGDTDLFLGRREANRLFQNQLIPSGVVGFEDVTAEAGLDDVVGQRTMGAGFGDYDNDGDLDLYLVNHTWCFPGVGEEYRFEDHLYRNDGGVFTEVTAMLDDGLGQTSDRVGFSAIWLDGDLDGDQDLFIANDHLGEVYRRNVLWRNDGPGAVPGEWTFTDISEASGFAPWPDITGKGVNAMGLAVGDVNRDGRPDLAFTNIGPNYLLLGVAGDDGPSFTDGSWDAGIMRSKHPWGRDSVTWGTHLFDYDNDGDDDLLYIGGAIKGDNPQTHAFFENTGMGLFEERTWEVGLAGPGHGKASAVVDLDGDGWLDVVVANWAGMLEVYRNVVGDDLGSSHWLEVELVGDGIRVNRDALGAVVEVELPDGEVLTCFRTQRPSLGGTSDLACHLGLGEQDRVERLSVVWPDGRRTDLLDAEVPDIDQRVVLTSPP